MKERWRLLGYSLGRVLPFGLLLSAAMLVIQQLVFRMTFRPVFGQVIPLEQAMQHAGFQPLFLTFLLLSMAVLAFTIVRRWLGSKSIYSLCMLPVPRGWLYGSWIVCGIVLLLLLILAQYGSLFLADGQYDRSVEQLIARTWTQTNERHTYCVEGNKLFLAFLRWEFLRPFLPYRFFEVLVAVCCLLGPPILTARLVCGIFAKKLPAALCAVAVWLVLAMVALSALRTVTVTAELCVAGLFLITAWTAYSGGRLIGNGDAL